MKRRFIHIFQKIRVPILYICFFILALKILSSFGQIIMKGSADERERMQSEKWERASIKIGSLNLDEYLIREDPSHDLGADFITYLYHTFKESGEIPDTYLNDAILTEYGYDCDPSFMADTVKESFGSSPGSYLLILNDSYTLHSGGRIFSCCLAKNKQNTLEFQYDSETQRSLSITVYYQNGVPVSFLPFAEPDLNAYKDLYHLTRRI